MPISERRTTLIISSGVALVLLAPPIRGAMVGWGMRWLYLLLLGFSLAFLATSLAKKVAWKLEALDIPGGRKVHESPTPLLGGAAIYAAFAAVVLLNFEFSWELKGVAIGATLILLLGLVDDLRPLPAWLKLTVQLCAVGILIRFGVVLSFLPEGPLGTLGEWVLTAIWVLGITNAMNFLDGLDGLAAGLAAINALFFTVMAQQTGQQYMGFLSVALLGSCLGFLPHNFRLKKPASIFLGDAGSTFLGFTLAGIAVMGQWAEERFVNIAIPVLILGVPIFDVTFTTVVRVGTGQVRSFGGWLSYTGRDHFHHRLLDIGLGRNWAVLTIYVISVWLGLSALVLKGATDTDALLVLIQAGIIFFLIGYFMLFVEKRFVRTEGAFLPDEPGERKRLEEICDAARR